METQSTYVPQPSLYERNRLLIKGFLIGFLILLMLVPAALISGLVNERANRRDEVVREVSSKWAGQQTITGPVLMIPYNYVYKGADGKMLTIRKQAYALPDELKITGQVLPEKRHRSLFEVTLYQSELNISGRFSAVPLASLGVDAQNVMWNEAKLLMGVNDTRGLQEEVALSWNNAQLHFEAGVPENQTIREGLQAAVPVSAEGNITFSAKLRLRGSENLSFTPVGKTTEVTLQSGWPHPDFNGQYIPDTPPAVSDKGFNAHWKILQASRPYPQSWKDGTPDIKASAFGVHLIQPTDGYAKTQRSVKYAILFIGLTFVVFFFLELLQKHQVHPLQYLLVGFALTIFYTLLLSISEYLGYNQAYLIAATATVSLVGLYVWNIFHSGRTAIGFSVALGVLYGYIFILIQLEDYALLFGSIGLFLILAAIMYCSRKIDWYGTGRHKVAAA